MIRAFQPHGIIRPIVSDRNYGNTGPAINESRVSAYSRMSSSPTPVNGSPIVTMSRDAAGLGDYIKTLTPLAKETAVGLGVGAVVGYYFKHPLLGAIIGGFGTSLIMSRIQANEDPLTGKPRPPIAPPIG